METKKINILEHESKIWAIADSLRSVGIVDDNVRVAMMPFFALMMVDSRMVRATEELSKQKEKDGLSKDEIIEELKEDLSYYNSSITEDNISLRDICKNDHNFNQNLDVYLNSYDDETKLLLGVDPGAGELEYLNIHSTIKTLRAKKILFSVAQQWSIIPFEKYNNSEITTLEEHIKRKWADISAGQFYTPSDIIDLIQKIISRHYKNNNKSGYIKIYDPTCGGGNMLFGIEDNLRSENNKSKIQSYGQEIDDELYALAKIESRFREEAFIKWGNTLTTDEFESEHFDYIAANPPYGYKWGDQEKEIKERGEIQKCYLDKYPSSGDGQLLFMQHIIHKMNQDGFAIVVSNGSPLFSGGAGSGESEIRKWILDNNYLEAIIQLPKEEFFNTKISTYLWILNKNKDEGSTKIKIIDASSLFKKLSKSKGDKSVEMTTEQQEEVVDLLFIDNKDSLCKVFDKDYFYFNKQSILLKHSDVNGKSVAEIIPTKIVKGEEVEGKSIILKDVASIELEGKSIISFTDGVSSITNNTSDEELRVQVKGLQQKFKDATENLTIKLISGDIYAYDKDKSTITQTSETGEPEDLGNGVIKVSVSYKKPTTKTGETFTCKVELLPKTEKDSEIIPFQEIQKGELVINDIDDFLGQWVEKDFDKLDNTVGVEINFNKIFYKYEKLRSIQDIVSNISDLEEQEQVLDKDIFDFSPIDMTELNIEE